MKNFLFGVTLSALLILAAVMLDRGFQPNTPSIISQRVGLMGIALPDTYGVCSDSSEIVRRVAYSLDTEPTKWTTNGYRIWREGGGAAWIANNSYGIEIGPSERQTGAVANSKDRECVWNAYSRWVTNAKRY